MTAPSQTQICWTAGLRVTLSLAEGAAAAGLSASGVRKRLRTLRERVAHLHPELRLPEMAS